MAHINPAEKVAKLPKTLCILSVVPKVVFASTGQIIYPKISAWPISKPELWIKQGCQNMDM